MERTASNRRATSSAGRLAVGSSITTIFAEVVIARAMATSDFSVLLSERTLVSGSISTPMRCSASRAARLQRAQEIRPKRRSKPRVSDMFSLTVIQSTRPRS
jgi:hypothetical protein